MSESKTKTLTAEDGTTVEAEVMPFDSWGRSTARVRLADGTEIEVGVEITKVYRGVIDRGDHYEVLHSLIFEQSLMSTHVPPELFAAGELHGELKGRLTGEPSLSS